MTDFVVRRRYVRVTPDKSRRAAALVKGKLFPQALAILKFSGLSASHYVELALKSAFALAREKEVPMEKLQVKNIIISEGPKLKRQQFIQQGRSRQILKRMSHITVILTDNGKSKSQASNSKQIPNSKQKMNNKNKK